MIGRVVRDPVFVILTMGFVALVVRAYSWLQPGSLLAEREYDDGVMFAASVATVHGLIPYADFTFLHPPGSIVLLAPFAVAANVWTDAQALAGARVALVFVGVANTVLVGVLLRPAGRLAIVVGAGAYAVWSNAVRAEETVLLEPLLNLCLLVALTALAARRLALVFVAGAALGLALTVKYWAAIDIVVVGAMVAVLWGWRGIWRLLVGGVAAALVIMLPFFVRAPGEMWMQTVLAQLGRPPSVSGAGPSVWGRHVSPIAGQNALDQLVPGLVWAGLFVALVLALSVPVLWRAWRERRAPSRWPDSLWWTLLLLAHFVALVLTGKAFYYHYASWIIAPLALCLGAATLGIRRIRMRRTTAVVAAAVIIGVGAGDLLRPTLPGGAPRELAAEASSYECVWGTPSQLIVADRLSSGIENGCDIDIDPFGVALTEFREGAGRADLPQWNDLWVAHAWAQITTADAVVIGVADNDEAFFTPERRAEFARDFFLVFEDGRTALWARD